MSGGGISKIGKVLIIIFVISLLTLLAELFYVLWRRRVFYRRSTPPATIQGRGAADNNSRAFSDGGSSPTKELLYFFCLNGAQIAPLHRNSAPPPSTLNSTESSSADDDQMEIIDLLKLQNMCGPPRFLFTINEEEKEADAEPDGKSFCSSAERGAEGYFKNKVAEESQPEEVVVAIGGDDGINTTPFSTPCESPLYFTPVASPTREIYSGEWKVETSF